MAFPTGWTLLQTCTIDNTKVSGSSNLTDFPVLLTANNILANTFSNTQGQEIYTNYLYADANLQGYWRLESDGTDSSGNGYDLTADNNAPDYTTGKFGNGADFDSANTEGLSIASASAPNLEISGSQTWSCWVKFENLGDYRLMWKRDTTNRGLQLYTDNKIYFAITGLSTATVATDVVEAGQWYHVVGVYDSSAGKLKVFLNGVKTEISVSGTVTANSGNFALAKNGSTDSLWLNGVLDDCAVWDRALTDDEVLGLYAGGQDLRFSSDDAGSTQIAHEVVRWNPDASDAEVWVKVPTVDYDDDTVFYLWGNNSTATPQARDLASYGSEAVWAEYAGVYHLENNGIDSTANEYTVAGNTPSFTTGKVGTSGSFDDASSHYLTRASTTNLYTTGSQTWQVWLKRDDDSTTQKAMAIRTTSNGTPARFMQYASNSLGGGGADKINIRIDGLSPNEIYTSSAYSGTGVDRFVVGRYDSSGGTLAIFMNTVKTSTAVTGSPTAITSNFSIGRNGQTTDGYFSGLLDEVRIATVARSDDWIATEYANQNAPDTFVTAAAVSASAIKKFSGVAQASLKKVSGVAEASIKKISGVANQ